MKRGIFRASGAADGQRFELRALAFRVIAITSFADNASVQMALVLEYSVMFRKPPLEKRGPRAPAVFARSFALPSRAHRTHNNASVTCNIYVQPGVMHPHGGAYVSRGVSRRRRI